MTFAETHPVFQKRVNKLAEHSALDVEGIYSLWRKYADDCQGYDQSPVMFEFIQWNKDQLGIVDVPAATAAAR